MQKRSKQEPTGYLQPGIVEALNRILHDSRRQSGEHETHRNMILRSKPNPFTTSITVDITCEYNRHVIVRLNDDYGKILKMLSWYLVGGSNITTINDLNELHSGNYHLDVLDGEGNIISSQTLSKL